MWTDLQNHKTKHAQDVMKKGREVVFINLDLCYETVRVALKAIQVMLYCIIQITYSN